MALTQPFTGSALTVSTTELSLVSGTSTLQTNSTAGIYQLFLDTSNLTATESYLLKIKEKVAAAGTQRLMQSLLLTGVQATPVYVSAAMQLMNGWDITLTKLNGTDRAFDYSIRQVA